MSALPTTRFLLLAEHEKTPRQYHSLAAMITDGNKLRLAGRSSRVSWTEGRTWIPLPIQGTLPTNDDY